MTGLLLLGVAAVLLSVGAEAFAENAAAAGRRLGVSALAVGLLLAGAEPEELITAVLAALRERPGIAVGDAIGANVTLVTLVLGALALIAAPVALVGRVRTYAMLAAAAAAVAVAAVVTGSVVSASEGLVLLALYAAVVATLWRRERRPPGFGEVADLPDDHDGQSHEPDGRLTRGLMVALGGVAMMGAGGWAAVSGAERVVAALGLTDTVVGLTLVALTTTAEFIALLIAATRRGITEVAVAAVFGSVLYNATVTLGAAALAAPLPTDTAVVAAAAAAAVLPVAAIALGGSRQLLRRPAGATLLCAYLLYLIAITR